MSATRAIVASPGAAGAGCHARASSGVVWCGLGLTCSPLGACVVRRPPSLSVSLARARV
jgi:hypothetical protein